MKLSLEQAGSAVGVGVGVTTVVGVGLGVATRDGVGVAAGVGVGVGTFFVKDVNVGPFKSNKPGNQYRQRSVVPSGTFTTVHG